jgi:hypothetical protein
MISDKTGAYGSESGLGYSLCVATSKLPGSLARTPGAYLINYSTGQNNHGLKKCAASKGNEVSVKISLLEVTTSPPSRMWEGRAPFSFRTGQ